MLPFVSQMTQFSMKLKSVRISSVSTSSTQLHSFFNKERSNIMDCKWGFVNSFAPGLSYNNRTSLLLCQNVSNHRQISTKPSMIVSMSSTPRRMPGIIRPMVPSPQLQYFVEDKAQPRTTVLKIINAYVKQNKLQDPSNKTMIICDAKLKELFGVDKCTILEINKYISPHLKKPEDVGGRYIDEAKQFEEKYFEQKDAEDSEEGTRKLRSNQEKKPIKRAFKPVLLSNELSAVCNSQKELTRPQIIKAIWEYIHLNNLQQGPGQPIRCDHLLRKVFNSDNIDAKTIMKGISSHVTKKN